MDNNINELEKLIDYIIEKHDMINSEWMTSNNYNKYNMKSKKVTDILKDSKLSDYIFDYRNFINIYYTSLFQEINNLRLKNQVEIRVKMYNSLQDKINRYCIETKHEYGHIPINKCVNDLLGFRIIFKKSIDMNQIIDYIKNKYNNLLCIDSSKDGYIATHIYFTKDSNYDFRWELQLWNLESYDNNKKCHEIYKQDYTKYESDLIREGDANV